MKLAEFSEEPFVIYSRESVPGMHALTMMACQDAGFVPRIAEEASQLQTIICLVESGIGVALVPTVIVGQTNAVDFVEIESGAVQTTIGLGIVIHSSRPPVAASRFRAFAVENSTL